MANSADAEERGGQTNVRNDVELILSGGATKLVTSWSRRSDPGRDNGRSGP
ncbi:MAG: hypothetical protein ACRCYU_09490 [Nocardioides sp.]